MILTLIVIGAGGLGLGMRTNYDFSLTTATVRYVPQDLGFDGQLGFVFDGGHNFLIGGAIIVPMFHTKYANLNLDGGLSYFNSEHEAGIVRRKVNFLEFHLHPEVELIFLTKNLCLEFKIPLLSLGFDFENDEEFISILMKENWIFPVFGFHFYF
ncbi:MAG TPA: hypothetical protein EYP24_04115 [bacterium (Candidatus Stahlbacteria)]|nr:hypothetical protein [Candidatus Stahlbacteria bacterium]